MIRKNLLNLSSVTCCNFLTTTPVLRLLCVSASALFLTVIGKFDKAAKAGNKKAQISKLLNSLEA